MKRFISYAHKDESLRQKLDTHLSLLKRQGVIEAWHDRLILLETDWAEEIDNNLNTADLILLLVSSDFLASDYCCKEEMQRAIALQRIAHRRTLIALRKTQKAIAFRGVAHRRTLIALRKTQKATAFRGVAQHRSAIAPSDPLKIAIELSSMGTLPSDQTMLDAKKAFMTDSSKRLSRQIIKDDTNSMTGLDTIANYSTDRREATSETIRTAYERMVKLQNLEIEQAEAARNTAIAARQAEVTFHKSIVAMREVVRGKYGSDSLEARNVGLVRTSERKPAKPKQKSA